MLTMSRYAYYKLLFKVRQRASSEHLITDWTYPMEDSALSIVERQYRCKYVVMCKETVVAVCTTSIRGSYG